MYAPTHICEYLFFSPSVTISCSASVNPGNVKTVKLYYIYCGTERTRNVWEREN